MEKQNDDGICHECDICNEEIDQDESNNHFIIEGDSIEGTDGYKDDRDVCGACFTKMKMLVLTNERENFCKKCQKKNDQLKKEYNMAKDL